MINHKGSNPWTHSRKMLLQTISTSSDHVMGNVHINLILELQAGLKDKFLNTKVSWLGREFTLTLFFCFC